MGVTGLWKLIEPTGKPVPLETLENKILAIDISIWLHQVVKGFQDSSGATLPHAHLLGLFHRLCKLLYYRIKPVFVFDGGVPALKMETMRKRSQNKRNYNSEADRLQQLLLESLSKEKIVQQALGATATQLLTPTKNSTKVLNQSDPDDLFKLPPMKEDTGDQSLDTGETTISSDGDSSFDEKNPRHYYNINLQNMDVTSSQFKDLPADVRHDILTDIKEKRKESSWGRLHELPTQSDDFSVFQMRRLLKRRAVQVSLEDAEKEMGGKCLSLGELEALLAEEGVVETTVINKFGNKIASDEHTRFLHIRNMNKAIKEEKEEQKEEECKPSSSKQQKTSVVETESIVLPTGDAELDEDLQRAIKMSLEEDDNKPSTSHKINAVDKELVCLSEDDEEMDEDLQKAIKMSLTDCGEPNTSIDLENPITNEVKLLPEQKKILGGYAKSLARAYMIEHGGMNAEDVDNLVALDEEENHDSTFRYNDLSILNGPCQTTNDPKTSDVSSDADSDFIDVPELTADIDLYSRNETTFSTVFTNVPPAADLSKDFRHADLEIIIQPSENIDDLFADVFDENTETKNSKPIIVNDEENNCIKSKLAVENILDDLKQEKENIGKINLDNLTSPTVTKPSTSHLENILENLNKEITEVTDINLDTVALPNQDENQDVIEILDDDDDSPLMRTPKKTKQMTLDKMLHVTPKKDDLKVIIQEPVTPKVASPFFRRKTPTSSKTTNSTEHLPQINGEKVAKQLFSNEPTKKATSAEVVEIAAQILRENKSQDELTEMASKMHQDTKTLEFERNKQNRLGVSITERMSDDCKQLLKLFGIPYIVAPMEAEAQCAFLDACNLTDGTITDDSDIWLFGGQTVYKHFFNQQKNVMEFRSENIENMFHVDRKKLIQLSVLVGSDYTTGITGIGAVTALEILASFSTTPEPNSEDTNETITMLSSLRKFKEWWTKGRSVGPKTTALRNKLKNITITDEFPSDRVIEAYTHPEVDDSLEKFTWGHPDAETIREFAKQTFGWTYAKTNDTLLPVLRKLDEKKSQQSIKNYFKNTGGITTDLNLAVSKRVRLAINKMSPNYKSDDEPTIKEKKVRGSRKKEQTSSDGQIKKVSKIKRKGVVAETMTSSTINITKFNDEVSMSLVAGPSKQNKSPRIPDANVPIPQREKDKQELEENKLKAINAFKLSKANKRKKL